MSSRLSLTAEEIERRSEWMWDWSGERPVPKFIPLCACDNSDFRISPSWLDPYAPNWLTRSWFFRRQPGADHRCPYRCDVTLKCQWCGLVLTFGVVVPVWWWEKHQPSESLVKWNDPTTLPPNGGSVAPD